MTYNFHVIFRILSKTTVKNFAFNAIKKSSRNHAEESEIQSNEKAWAKKVDDIRVCMCMLEIFYKYSIYNWDMARYEEPSRASFIKSSWKSQVNLSLFHFRLHVEVVVLFSTNISNELLIKVSQLTLTWSSYPEIWRANEKQGRNGAVEKGSSNCGYVVVADEGRKSRSGKRIDRRRWGPTRRRRKGRLLADWIWLYTQGREPFWRSFSHPLAALLLHTIERNDRWNNGTWCVGGTFSTTSLR